MSRQQISLLITLLLGVFMGALDIFIVAPALGAIQLGLHISASAATWSFSAYTLVLVVTQPLIGKLSDRLGRRWIYIACVVCFGAGSALCGVATGFAPFLLGRGIQALGAGGILPLASAVIADTFPENRRGAALGIVGSVFGLAFIVGPLIGGLLTSGVHLGGWFVTDWRAIFFVNLPFVVLISVLATHTIPLHSAHPAATLRFDWYGAALLALALFCLVFGLTQIDFANLGANFKNEAAAPLIILGFVFFIPFWLNEQRTPDPIISPRVFSRHQLLLAMGLSIAAGIVTSSIVYVPQFVEATQHLHRAGAGGSSLTWVALTLTMGTPLTGRLIDRVGSRSVMIFGGSVTALGLILLLTIGSGPGGLVASLLILGLGLSTFVGTPLRYIVINEAPPERRAASLAVLTVCNSIGQTVILPLGGALLASATRSDLSDPATATVQAIQLFYTFVLMLVLGAIFLALHLNGQVREVADRQPRARPRHQTLLRAETIASQTKQGEPVTAMR